GWNRDYSQRSATARSSTAGYGRRRGEGSSRTIIAGRRGDGPVDVLCVRNDEAPMDLARRRSLMAAALGFMQLQSSEPPAEIRMLGRWLNSWTGLGAVVIGMRAQSSDVELNEFPDGWRATFYPIGIAHSVVEGSA